MATAALAMVAALSGKAQAQPVVQEELRAAWIATVGGLDWPSSSQSTGAQKKALTEKLDLLAENGFNAVVFQVRGECDAIYPSELEPWNRAVAGSSGERPFPLFDPLQFALEESRRRGLEFHAWFNPYRAATNASNSFAASHVSNTRPNIVRNFENFLWLDPGDPETRQYSLDVIMDVVRRYDVDGVHFDDYFYPYNIDDQSNPFPDSTTFAAHNPGGLSLGDWRRENVRLFIEQVYTAIRNEPGKENVRFGISPFGIFRTGSPPGIVGYDAFGRLYADGTAWLAGGIIDYFCPQIYWGRAADGYSTQQDFDAILNWWTSSTRNPLGRRIYAGLPNYKLATGQLTDAQHLVNQIVYTRNRAGASGTIHFRMNNLQSNTANMTTLIRSQVYGEDARLPNYPWLDGQAPPAPRVTFDDRGGANTPYTFFWEPTGSEANQWYLLQYRRGSTWTSEVISANFDRREIPSSAGSPLNEFRLTPVDRSGNTGTPAIITIASGTPFPPPATPTWTLLEDFESTTPGNDVMFRDPGFSSTSSGVADGDFSYATSFDWNNRLDLRLGDPGDQAHRNQWSWTTPGQGLVRLTTFNVVSRPNPLLDLRQGLGFYIRLDEGSLDLRLLLRETGGNGPIGANGGSTGSIELSTNPIRIEGSPNWQYVHFDLPNMDWTSFSAGNGNLDGDWGVLEALYIEAVAGDPTTDFALFMDDFYQGPPMELFDGSLPLPSNVEASEAWMIR